MKKFVAIFLGSEASRKKWEALDENTREEKERAGMAAWHEWAAKNQRAIVGMGSPLGKTKRVDAQGVSDTKNDLTAYTVVEAESHEAAARLFLDHPHFSIFPGDRVEVLECLPIPGM
jgi:hypothetical protein